MSRHYDRDNLNFSYYSRYFSATKAKEIYQRLENDIKWLSLEDTRIIIYGKPVSIPRKMACFGEKGITYKFSGKTFPAKEWPPVLLFLREIADEIFRNLKEAEKFLPELEEAKRCYFNFAVVNYYKDGDHNIGAHKDNEKDLDPLIPIISFSFGATRKFIFRRKGYEKVENPLEEGSVLVMKPPTNEYWTHEIPKEKKIKEPRINITFRRIVNERRVSPKTR